jgi:hypothetical protein
MGSASLMAAPERHSHVFGADLFDQSGITIKGRS